LLKKWLRNTREPVLLIFFYLLLYAGTKTLVHQISVSKSNEELAEALKTAKKEAE
jgi:hypothetical protein